MAFSALQPVGDGEVGRVIGDAWRLHADDSSALRDAEERALRDGHADLVVHAAALRALHLSSAPERRTEAVEVARRASRMARTEAQPEMEYLAHLVLARVRRLAGRPYLATRILSALTSYASERWQAWLAWELCMANGLSAPIPSDDGLPSALYGALRRAHEGDRGGFGEQVDRLLAEAAWPPLARDVAAMRSVVDASSTSDDPTIEAWCEGEGMAPPHGLIGLGSGEDVGAIACIVTAPDRLPRRVLRFGTAMVRGAFALEPTPRRGSRVDTMLAVLALASEGIELATLFRRVWGFKFVASLHDEVLEVTLHRARQRLGDAARVDRQQGLVRLSPNRPLIVPDPRCSPDVDERVLQYVAQRGRASARDAARALGLSLRAVQSALKELVEGGLCDRQRDGRAIVYGVEDTTFREPTAH